MDSTSITTLKFTQAQKLCAPPSSVRGAVIQCGGLTRRTPLAAFAVVRRFKDLEGTHQGLVYAHHCPSIVKFATVVRRRKKGDQATVSKKTHNHPQQPGGHDKLDPDHVALETRSLCQLQR